MKGVLLVKIFRLDLEPGFSSTSARVRASVQQDWSKLVKIIPFVLGTRDEVLTLSTDDSYNLH